MSKEQMIVAIVVAIIGVIGTAVGSSFAFLQFMIKRKDDKKENNVLKLIDEAVSKAKEEMHDEFEKGLAKRGKEGKERFDINSKQIQQNAEALSRLLTIQEEQTKKVDVMMDSLTSLNTVTKACAEGVRSTLYDKIYIVAERAIARKGITADEQANVTQLWTSYSALGGNGKGKTYARICMEDLDVITDDEAKRLDNKILGTNV
jgi:hypothetical protein